MRRLCIALLVSLVAGAAQADSILWVTNNIIGYNEADKPQVATEGQVRLNVIVTDGVDPIDMSGSFAGIYMELTDRRDGLVRGIFDADKSPYVDLSVGHVRFIIPEINPGLYTMQAWAMPTDTNDQYRIAWHELDVTAPPTGEGGFDVYVTFTNIYPTTILESGVTDINDLTGSVRVVAGDNINITTNDQDIVISGEAAAAAATNATLLILDGTPYDGSTPLIAGDGVTITDEAGGLRFDVPLLEINSNEPHIPYTSLSAAPTVTVAQANGRLVRLSHGTNDVQLTFGSYPTNGWSRVTMTIDRGTGTLSADTNAIDSASWGFVDVGLDGDTIDLYWLRKRDQKWIVQRAY